MPVAGGLDRGSIPYPLAAVQTLALDDPGEAAQFFRDLGTTLSDPPTFAADVTALAAEVEQSAAAAEGWEGVELNERYFAWLGPLHKLDDRRAIQTPPGLKNLLQQHGLSCTDGSARRLQHHLQKERLQVFETDRETWKRPVVRSPDDDRP